MTKQKCKTEKIDLNPSRVQNPFEHLKRSPGKFDQKVYMEQELFSSNKVRFYKRLYNTQQQAQLNSYDKYMNELRRRNTELRAQNEEYAYLRTLRTALHKENIKRQRETKTPRPVTPEEVRRRLSIERRKTMAAAEEEKESQPIITTETDINIQPTENGSNQPATNSAEEKVDEEKQPTDEDEISSVKSFTEMKPKVQKKKNPPRKKRPVSPGKLATLESLSYEIMTSTLPIGKMKRILPDETLPVQEKWPILSNYRKQEVLPSVKAGKQQITEDMGSLHMRINQYFGCDNFPLWRYKYVAKDYPTKYKLLKAVETEGIQLPTLPKH